MPLFLLVLGRLPRLAPLGETLFLALFNLVFFTGVRLAPASDASAVAALYPLSTAFAYSLYFRKPLGPSLLGGLVLSGTGVGLLALGQAGGGGEGSRLLGDLLLVLAALLWGAYSVGVALAVRRRSPLEATAASLLLALGVLWTQRR
nr:EamA family transporter [Thermus islandicus]